MLRWLIVRFIASTTRCAEVHERTDDCTYQVAWAINPHMVVGSVRPCRADAQHRGLLRAVASIGADVQVLPFVHAAFDSVFAKDNAIYAARTGRVRALLGRPRHAERRIEQAARAAELARKDVEVRHQPYALEGGDVLVVPGRYALLGHGFRSSRVAASQLEAFLGLPVLALELVDPALYHLDTALAVLADGTALICDEAFSPASRQALRALRLGDTIAVSRHEALRFALNLVEVGDAVVTGTRSAEVDALLAARGKRVVYAPLDEFHRAGGSAACLLAPIYDADAAVMTAPTAAMRSTAA